MISGEENYLTLLHTITKYGYNVAPAERQGVGTQQINAWMFQHDLRTGFPLLTTKKVAVKAVKHELLWFLRGDTNIKYLVDNGVDIWNKDAYNYFKLQAKKENTIPMEFDDFIERIKEGYFVGNYYPNYTLGDLGPVYGKQWRNWGEEKGTITENFNTVSYSVKGIDQISNLITNIKKAIANGYNNRRLIVSAWNVAEIDDMALPPCHKDFQIILEPIPVESIWTKKPMFHTYNSKDKVNIDELTNLKESPKYYFNLIWNQRSVDTFLGLPFNIASYAFLAHLLGKITNTIPKELVGMLTNVHIYDNHKEQVDEQLSRESRELPKFKFKDNLFDDSNSIDDILEYLEVSDFILEGYEPHPAIKAEMIS